MPRLVEVGARIILAAMEASTLVGIACSAPKPIETSQQSQTIPIVSSPPDTASVSQNRSLTPAEAKQDQSISEARKRGELLKKIDLSHFVGVRLNREAHLFGQFRFTNQTATETVIDLDAIPSLVTSCRLDKIPSNIPLSVNFVDDLRPEHRILEPNSTYGITYGPSQRGLVIDISIRSVSAQARKELGTLYAVDDHTQALPLLETVNLNASMITALCLAPYFWILAQNPLNYSANAEGTQFSQAQSQRYTQELLRGVSSLLAVSRSTPIAAR